MCPWIDIVDEQKELRKTQVYCTNLPYTSRAIGTRQKKEENPKKKRDVPVGSTRHVSSTVLFYCVFDQLPNSWFFCGTFTGRLPKPGCFRKPHHEPLVKEWSERTVRNKVCRHRWRTESRTQNFSTCYEKNAWIICCAHQEWRLPLFNHIVDTKLIRS